MLKVVDIECIRKLHYKKGWSIRKIAQELRHSRKTVRKAIHDAGPWEYRLSRPRPSPVSDPVREIIRQWLIDDQEAPKKQRHTAKRIYERLRDEHNFEGGESTIRRVVAQLRREVETVPVEPCFVLRPEPGEMAQMDWGQAKVILAGMEMLVRLFCIRLRYSGVAFVRASLHERLEAVLEGHVKAFEWFGGVPGAVVYDNMPTIVRNIVPGQRERDLSEGFIAMRSHYVFESVFANPGAAHEKGSVEHLVGYVRRNALVPMPRVDTLEELNALLLAWCSAERDKRSEAWAREQKALFPIPSGSYKPCVSHYLTVNKLSLVTFQRNRYSVPTRLIGQVVRADVYAERLELFHGSECVAIHRRATGRGHSELALDHYLEALARKPYAVSHAAVVRNLPEPYGALREHLLARDPSGYREFVQVLLLHREFSAEQVRVAVTQALAAGSARADDVRQALLIALDKPYTADGSRNHHVEVPVGDPRRYDVLAEVGA